MENLIKNLDVIRIAAQSHYSAFQFVKTGLLKCDFVVWIHEIVLLGILSGCDRLS